jgi:excinuclease ABC subunit A
MSTLSIRGARQHNLASIDVDLPRERLVVVCGPSGSGKSSLAFDTIHAEGRRRYLEALAGAVRVGKALPRPDVDLIVGLPPTLALDQRWGAPTGETSVASYAELWPVLRVLWARAGVQHCPSCDAEIRPLTHDEMVGRLLALPEGTALTIEAPVRLRGVAALEEAIRAGFSRMRVDGAILRAEEIAPSQLEHATNVRVVIDRIKLASDHRDRVHDAVRLAARAGAGVVLATWGDGGLELVDRPYCVRCNRSFPPLEPRLLSYRHPEGRCPDCEGTGVMGELPCAACGGSRLGEVARAVRWRGRSLARVQTETVAQNAAFFSSEASDRVSEIPLGEIVHRLGLLARLGLGALPLGRPAAALSTGEQQRIRLARAVAGRMSGVLYVLDEPSAGLAPDDVDAVVDLLRGLVDAGNGVLAVEHHPAVLAAADHVLELGPGAGRDGGRIVFEGTSRALLHADTATGRWLSGRERLSKSTHVPGPGVLSGGRDLPTHALVALVGPSGSGKSSLLTRIEADPQFPRVVRVDRMGVRAARSTPATYTGVWDLVRELLAATREAQIRGFNASFFSLAVKGGRCEACQGTGVRRVDLQVLPDVWLPCETCGGRRFAADVREVRWKGLSPDELLDLTIAEASPILGGHPKIDAILRVLRDVGLGYVPLGLPTAELSGGEAQRLALARELLRAGAPEGALYLVDGPTLGLHPADVAVLLHVLRRLVEQGGTVWAATHDPAFAAASDAIVDLTQGPAPAASRPQ